MHLTDTIILQSKVDVFQPAVMQLMHFVARSTLILLHARVHAPKPF